MSPRLAWSHSHHGVRREQVSCVVGVEGEGGGVRDKRLGDPGMAHAVRPNGDRPIIMG
jgi:hypothetical protein